MGCPSPLNTVCSFPVQCAQECQTFAAPVRMAHPEVCWGIGHQEEESLPRLPWMRQTGERKKGQTRPATVKHRVRIPIWEYVNARSYFNKMIFCHYYYRLLDTCSRCNMMLCKTPIQISNINYSVTSNLVSPIHQICKICKSLECEEQTKRNKHETHRQKENKQTLNRKGLGFSIIGSNLRPSCCQATELATITDKALNQNQ